MILRFDEAQLTAELSLLPNPLRVIFASACAERMMSAYRSFHVTSGQGDPSALDEALEDLWNNPVCPPSDDSAMQNQLRKVMDLIPQEVTGTEIWPQEATYAQHFCLSLAYALRARLYGQPQEAVWAARVAYEALDDFVISREGIDTNQPGAEEFLLAHQIIRKELERQRRDISELAESSGEEMRELVARFRDRSRAEAGSFFDPLAD